MSEALDKLKASLMERHRLWALANPEEAKRDAEKLAAGIRDIPERQMLDQLQRLEKDFLPALKKRGREDEFLFFESICRSLTYSIILCDRYEYLHGRYINALIEREITKDHLLLVEKELQRYSTVEDLMLSDGLDKYAEGVAERVKKDILRIKK